jgi:hypothetical protein
VRLELSHQSVDVPPLARQRREQAAEFCDLGPGGLLGSLLGRHEPFQRLRLGALLAGQVFQSRNFLKHPRCVVAAAENHAHRALHDAHVASGGEPRHLLLSAVELAAQPQRLGRRRPGRITRLGEHHQLTAILPG